MSTPFIESFGLHGPVEGRSYGPGRSGVKISTAQTLSPIGQILTFVLSVCGGGEKYAKNRWKIFLQGSAWIDGVPKPPNINLNKSFGHFRSLEVIRSHKKLQEATRGHSPQTPRRIKKNGYFSGNDSFCDTKMLQTRKRTKFLCDSSNNRKRLWWCRQCLIDILNRECNRSTGWSRL